MGAAERVGVVERKTAARSSSAAHSAARRQRERVWRQLNVSGMLWLATIPSHAQPA